MRQYIRLHVAGSKAVPLTVSVEEFSAVQGQPSSAADHNPVPFAPSPPPSTVVMLRCGATYTVVESADDVIRLLHHAELIDQNNQANVSFVSNGVISAILVQ